MAMFHVDLLEIFITIGMSDNKGKFALVQLTFLSPINTLLVSLIKREWHKRMYIRQATLEENSQLQQLQAKCPQGRTIIVSIVNRPDFLVRAKAYRFSKIFIASEDNRIVGSAPCAIRNGMINGTLQRIGDELQ